MNFLVIFCILLASIWSQTFGLEPVTDDAMRLRKELFDLNRYDVNNAPNAHDNSMLGVTMKLMALHVYDINEYAGVMTVNGWFLASWSDYRLRWNPEDYGQVYFLRVPQYAVWLPDLTLYNDAEALYMNKVGYAQILLYRDGTVYWGAPTTLKSTCVIDHKYFPFDEHYCPIDIGSWSNGNNMALDVHYLDKQHEEDILKHFEMENPMWDVFSRKDEVVNRTYVCCPNSVFPYFKLELGLRRRAPFYKILLITPSVISMLLTLAVFWIPVEGHGNAKLIVGGTSTAILVFIMLFLSYHVPPGGKSIPAIVLFCGNSLVMSSLTIVASIAIMKINRQSHTRRPVPTLIKSITGVFGKCLCLERGNSPLWTKFISTVSSPGPNKDDPQLLDNNQVEIGGESSFPATGNDGQSINRDWIEVSIAFDRICFIVYCFIFFCIIFASFV